MNDCIFCKIAKGEIDSRVIYEDEDIKAFLDVNPEKTGHTLIIPKKHYKDMDDIDIKVLTKIMTVAKDIKRLLEVKLNATGVKFVQNNGSLQEIKHFHLHLVTDSTKDLSLDEVYELLLK